MLTSQTTKGNKGNDAVHKVWWRAKRKVLTSLERVRVYGLGYLMEPSSSLRLSLVSLICLLASLESSRHAYKHMQTRQPKTLTQLAYSIRTKMLAHSQIPVLAQRLN
jgi:hypothetical protein